MNTKKLIVEYKGAEWYLPDLAKRYNISYSGLYRRLFKLKMNLDDAIITPVNSIKYKQTLKFFVPLEIRKVFSGMKCRCANKKDKAYKNYGARGISVCDEWLKDRYKFYKWAMDNGWQKGLTIDRINNDGNYSPDNCRFATHRQQILNRRNTAQLTFNGITKPLQEWADDYNMKFDLLYKRIHRTKMPVELALTLKASRGNTMAIMKKFRA